MAEPRIFSADLLVSTLNKFSPTIYDNVTLHNPLLKRMREGGRIKMQKGGLKIVEAMVYQENDSFSWIVDGDKIKYPTQSILTQSIWDFRTSEITVSMKMEEEAFNQAGEQQLHNLLTARMENAKTTFSNKIGKAEWSFGEEDKELEGIPVIISDDPTSGTVGGINRATKGNEWWRNQVYSFADAQGIDPTSEPTPEQFYEGMEQFWIKLTRNAEHPTVIFMDTNYYNLYRRYLADKVRIVATKTGDTTFSSFEFHGIPVIYDLFIKPNHAYFINENYLFLKVMEGHLFNVMPKRLPADELMEAIPMTFMGNFTCSNSNLQGVMIAGAKAPARM